MTPRLFGVYEFWFWVFYNRLSLSDHGDCIRFGSFRKVANTDFAMDYGIQDNITRANKRTYKEFISIIFKVSSNTNHSVFHDSIFSSTYFS